ncbi:MAG: hypothetical protein ACRD1H_21065, partial [Vicinamibacterales bacterium]
MLAAIPRYRAYYQTFGFLRERETRIFSLAALAIALHRIDDAFLQMNPGTSAGDHLVSGGLPVAILLATFLAWPLLANSLRASVALLLGALAVTTGVVSNGYHSYSEGPSGSDFSGLLAIASGVVLLALGGWLTHRAIAKPVRRNWRWAGKRTLAIVAGVAIMLYLVAPLTLATFVTDFSRLPVCCETPADYGLAYEDVTFRGGDGLSLAGWYIPSSNGAAIIALPGINTRVGVIRHAAFLAQHGYGVLLFDKRGAGESEGDPH